MKNFKKTLALVLVFCIVVSVTSVAAAFTDVSDVYVDSLAEKGIARGYSSDLFAPSKLCTREEFLTFLYRAAGEPEVKVTNAFSDVSEGAYYANAVSWSYENGITNGAGDGRFGVGMTFDRNLASYYLYKWASVTGNGNMTDSCYLSEYTDGETVALYARTSYAWAIGSGAFEVKGNALSTATEVTRGEAAAILARLLSKHYHVWGEYTDNGDGTHTRVCKKDASHVERGAHTYNDGELIRKVTEKTNGKAVYTCTACLNEKTEKIKKGTEVVTRAGLEEAVLSLAWAYYSKGAKLQYDETHFSKLIAPFGGISRHTARHAPEFATEDFTFYSVCTDFTFQAYLEAINIYAHGDVTSPYGIYTNHIFRTADNQQNTRNGEETLNSPLTEEDVDAALVRWLDYDRYDTTKRDSLYVANTLESDSFTEAFPGLVYKNDAPDGESHYGYYDKDGNALTPSQVRADYIKPYVEDCDKYFRPGDYAVYGTHAMLYMGKNCFLHCTGSLIDAAGRTDNIEASGAIHLAWNPDPTAPLAIRALAPRVLRTDNFVQTRPLDFVVAPGYDEDPGNDMVSDLTIPEDTKSRIEYPNLEIDRTVNITGFGTAVKGENLTYSIKISNRTNDEPYLNWYALVNNNQSGEVVYKGIKVTETIPEGCEFVETDGKFDNGVITWNLDDIKPGETVEVSYTVKVVAEIGDTIVSDGGMVESIPSNRIENTVGGAKLSDGERETLAGVSKNLEAFGGDTDFAEGIYRAMGRELDLPSTTEIIDNLFTYQLHVPGSAEGSGGFYAPRWKTLTLFIRQANVPAEYTDIKTMLIDRYWGGTAFYVGDDLKWEYGTNAIRDFKTSYLEAGDILVYVNVTENKSDFSYSPKHIVVTVYDGEKLLSSDKSAEGVTYSVYEGDAVKQQLLEPFFKREDGEKYQLFFALRPSQVKS